MQMVKTNVVNRKKPSGTLDLPSRGMKQFLICMERKKGFYLEVETDG